MYKAFPELSVAGSERPGSGWVRQDGFRGSLLPTQLSLLPFLVTPFPPTPTPEDMYSSSNFPPRRRPKLEAHESEERDGARRVEPKPDPSPTSRRDPPLAQAQQVHRWQLAALHTPSLGPGP